MTPYQKHKAKWIGCTRCVLHERRDKVCLLRGKIPADVLFIGEAPGASENVLGKPFAGPAGHLLDSIVETSLAPRTVRRGGKLVEVTPTYAMTNLVGCIPLGDNNAKTHEPPEESIDACYPRLFEIVRLVKPRLIVQVGRLAHKHVGGQADFCFSREDGHPPWIPEGEFLEFVEITHPAAILRMDISQKGLAVQRCRVRLADAVDRLYSSVTA